MKITLTGIVKRETEKAVLFHQAGGIDTFKLNKEEWLPKKCIMLFERAMGNLDQVIIPEWLFTAKTGEKI